MSYDLAVWYPDRHLDDEQALAQYYELCEGDIGGLKHHPSIDAFHLAVFDPQLTKIHYPNG